MAARPDPDFRVGRVSSAIVGLPLRLRCSPLVTRVETSQSRLHPETKVSAAGAVGTRCTPKHSLRLRIFTARQCGHLAGGSSVEFREIESQLPPIKSFNLIFNL